jgi:hypothetical protein
MQKRMMQLIVGSNLVHGHIPRETDHDIVLEMIICCLLWQKCPPMEILLWLGVIH